MNKGGGSKKIPFTPEQLSEMRRLYMDEGETIMFLSKRYGVSTVVIRNRLDSMVEVRPKKPQVARPDIKSEKAAEPAVKPKRRIVGVNI